MLFDNKSDRRYRTAGYKEETNLKKLLSFLLFFVIGLLASYSIGYAVEESSSTATTDEAASEVLPAPPVPVAPASAEVLKSDSAPASTPASKVSTVPERSRVVAIVEDPEFLMKRPKPLIFGGEITILYPNHGSESVLYLAGLFASKGPWQLSVAHTEFSKETGKGEDEVAVEQSVPVFFKEWYTYRYYQWDGKKYVIVEERYSYDRQKQLPVRSRTSRKEDVNVWEFGISRTQRIYRPFAFRTGLKAAVVERREKVITTYELLNPPASDFSDLYIVDHQSTVVQENRDTRVVPVLDFMLTMGTFEKQFLNRPMFLSASAGYRMPLQQDENTDFLQGATLKLEAGIRFCDFPVFLGRE